jgi:hypothetical protein
MRLENMEPIAYEIRNLVLEFKNRLQLPDLAS